MVKALRSIDLREATDLLRIAQEVSASWEGRVLMHHDEALAILTPAKAKLPRARKRRKTGLVTEADPLWSIVGIAHTTGPTDVAANKHRYLAEAYAAERL